LRPLVDQLIRAYVEQGSESGRVLLDQHAEFARQDSNFAYEVEMPGFLDQLDQELAASAQRFRQQSAAAESASPSLTDPLTTFDQNLREAARLVDEERAAADATARDAAPATPEPAAPTEPAPMRLADPAPPKPELPIDKEATERLVVSLRKRESVLNKLMECMA